MLGLPAHVTACLFDLDGVLTQTARVHNAAWTQTFDEFLRQRATVSGEPFQPFDPGPDYNHYVDGRPRADGVRDVPRLPRASCCPRAARTTRRTRRPSTASATARTSCCCSRSATDGVEVYPGSVRYLKAATAAGLRRAVVSASANAGRWSPPPASSRLLEARVDGLVARAQGLRGKPHPDTFLAGARAARRRPDAGRRLRGRARRGGRRPRRWLRVRGRRRPGRAGRRAARPRRRHRGADLADLLDARTRGANRTATDPLATERGTG